jgi:hypothetical protein
MKTMTKSNWFATTVLLPTIPFFIHQTKSNCKNYSS